MSSIPSTEHVWSNGCKDKCGMCSECNLSVCTICGEFEGGLATHCPGKGNHPPDGLDVYKGEVDFRAGKWRVGLRNRVMLWPPEEAITVEQAYLEQLQAEGADPAFIQDAQKQIAKWESVVKKR